MNGRRIIVGLLDDDEQLRAYMRLLLRKEPLFAPQFFSQAKDAISAAVKRPFDVFMVDLYLPGGPTGLEVIRLLKGSTPGTRRLVFSNHDDWRFVCEAIRAGADGYLLKGDRPEELLAGIRAAHAGGVAFSMAIQMQLARFIAEGRKFLPATDLSPTEEAVLELYDQGLPYKTIADRLHMSLETVKTHAGNIIKKSFASSLREASAVRRYINPRF